MNSQPVRLHGCVSKGYLLPVLAAAAGGIGTLTTRGCADAYLSMAVIAAAPLTAFKEAMVAGYGCYA